MDIQVVFAQFASKAIRATILRYDGKASDDTWLALSLLCRKGVGVARVVKRGFAKKLPCRAFLVQIEYAKVDVLIIGVVYQHDFALKPCVKRKALYNSGGCIRQWGVAFAQKRMWQTIRKG